MQQASIGQRMRDNDGIGAGFDTLRLSLSVAVILWHCIPLAKGTPDFALATPLWTPVYVIIPIFFALSGFLVTGSALRLTVGKFAASRVLRIVPALAVDTLVSIFLIGIVVTTLPIGEYFSKSETWLYFLNIVGEIRYDLPGVFLENPYEGVVNGSLWTIRPELACYALMFLLIATKLVQRWQFIVVATLGSFAVYALFRVNLQGVIPEGLLAQQGLQKLVAFFFLGGLAFHLRDRIPYSIGLFCLSLTVIVIGMIFGNGDWAHNPVWVILSSPFLVYIMAFAGVTRLPAIPFFNRGDYSYGIYLYGFPVQQAIVHFTGVTNPLLLFALAMPPIILFAVFSWHIVEKPTLKLRKTFSMAARMERARQKELADEKI